MKKAALFLSFVLIALSMSSCSQVFCKWCPTTTEYIVQLKDTTIIKEILKDTTIIVPIPADSIITILVVECDSLGMAQMKEAVIQHKNMVAKLKVENGKLTQNITQLMDSLMVTIHYKEKQITTLKEKLETTTNTIEKQVKYIPKYIKILATIGTLSIILLLLLIVYNLGLRNFVSQAPSQPTKQTPRRRRGET